MQVHFPLLPPHFSIMSNMWLKRKYDNYINGRQYRIIQEASNLELLHIPQTILSGPIQTKYVDITKTQLTLLKNYKFVIFLSEHTAKHKCNQSFKKHFYLFFSYQWFPNLKFIFYFLKLFRYIILQYIFIKLLI